MFWKGTLTPSPHVNYGQHAHCPANVDSSAGLCQTRAGKQPLTSCPASLSNQKPPSPRAFPLLRVSPGSRGLGLTTYTTCRTCLFPRERLPPPPSSRFYSSPALGLLHPRKSYLSPVQARLPVTTASLESVVWGLVASALVPVTQKPVITMLV